MKPIIIPLLLLLAQPAIAQQDGTTQTGTPADQQDGTAQTGTLIAQQDGTAQTGTLIAQQDGTVQTGTLIAQQDGTVQTGTLIAQQDGTAQTGTPADQQDGTVQTGTPVAQQDGTAQTGTPVDQQDETAQTGVPTDAQNGASRPGMSADREGWTAQQCMQYAVGHNHEVRQSELALDSRRAERTAAIGAFLPAVSAAASAQYNFGRAIDPETNTYTDVNTFYSGYQVGASLPVFDGLSRLHALRAARAGVLMGRHALRQQQDETALAVLQAYTDAAYAQAMADMARERVAETELLLSQTRLLEEVGQRSAADVAQVEAQRAEADYDLTHWQGLQASALLQLKLEMAYPMDDTLAIEARLTDGPADLASLTAPEASAPNAELEVARWQVETTRHEWHEARSALSPTLSVSAGVSTTYYHTLHTNGGASFADQWDNNMGQYVSATLSVPLFDRMQTATRIRRARNDLLAAREAYEQKRLTHEKLRCEAMQDLLSYERQTLQMEHKVEADSIAYRLTRAQYDEGLATAIDLHTTSAQLMQSRALLLQCRLMQGVKAALVRYYHGACIWQ